MTQPILENIEWVDSWVPGARQNDAIRLLACGDSICRSYYQSLHKQCLPHLVSSRFSTSRYVSNPDYMADLLCILQRHTYAAIALNCGLHGWAYSEDEYEQDLSDFTSFLHAELPATRIVWIHTTPIRDWNDLSRLRDPEGEYQVGNDRVAERNERAARIMSERQIPICDLYTPLLERPELYAPDGTHFTEEGATFLADKITSSLKDSLPDLFVTN